MTIAEINKKIATHWNNAGGGGKLRKLLYI